MINRLDAQSIQFLANLQRIQERSQRAERQIASGIRLEKASDAPEQVIEILQLRTRVELNVQTQTNLARVNAQVNAAESAVREAVSIVERVRVLGAQAATHDAASRLTMGQQVKHLHDTLISLTGTSAEGRFVFAGDGATAPPYQADPLALNGVQRVSGATTNTAQVVDERNIVIGVARTASEVFDAPGTANVFRAVEDVARAMALDDQDAVKAALPNVVNALDHLNAQLAFYGTAQNRVTSALHAAKKNATNLHSSLSKLQDTDLPAAILELNAAKLHHEAALMAQSKVPRSTLFDFLG
ncbi:MAG TPA: flagellin [Bryobacteraceae bacterium]|nr:flagellin [Bryobacteraceae bacterium]